MIIEGISEELQIELGYTVDTVYAYMNDWFKLANGDYHTVDLGQSTDKYRATFSVKGDYNTLLEYASIMFEAREFSIQCSSEGEEIFGSEVTYGTALSCVLVSAPTVSHDSLGWGNMVVAIMLANTSDLQIYADDSLYTWDTIPWQFGNIATSEMDWVSSIFYGDGVHVSTLDTTGSKTSVSFVLTLREARWLKSMLVSMRATSMSLPTTFAPLFYGTVPDAVEMRVLSFSESRESVNLYNITINIFVHEV